MFKRIIGLGLALSLTAQATSIEGTVVYVYDGDTLLLSEPTSKQPVKVRLADIDTPEIRQDYGRYARDALISKVFQKKVRVKTLGQDKYQRLIGRLFLESRCIECEMVVEGHAWVLPKRWHRAVLYQYEAAARQAQKGLWHQKITLQQPPWLWRKQQLPKR